MRRLSYEEARLKGSVDVNPGRFASRKNSPRTAGSLGTAPRNLSADAKKVWKELAAVIPVGVAGEGDRTLLEIAANLLSQFRADPAAMRSSRLSLLLQTLGRLGLDPQARTKIQVEVPAKPSAKATQTTAFQTFMDAEDEDE